MMAMVVMVLAHSFVQVLATITTMSVDQLLPFTTITTNCGSITIITTLTRTRKNNNKPHHIHIHIHIHIIHFSIYRLPRRRLPPCRYPSLRLPPPLITFLLTLTLTLTLSLTPTLLHHHPSPFRPPAAFPTSGPQLLPRQQPLTTTTSHQCQPLFQCQPHRHARRHVSPRA